MRFGVAWAAYTNAYYRAIEPMNAMARRGYEIVWPEGPGTANARHLAACDVVHIYRASDETTRRLVAQLMRGGTAITYDNDDDLTAVPKESASYKDLGGHKGQRAFAETVAVARIAKRLTTTNEVLADKYRKAGVKRIGVIANCLAKDAIRPRRPHDGIVVGWVARGEHRADAERLKIADALERVIDKHPEVHVKCIGLNLALPRRYTHVRYVDFHELQHHIGDFDVGIAPLADIPMNRARSDIKIKEYAAVGIPWLASPVGPYVGLGENQGGRLVGDEAWFDALDQMVSDHAARQRLGRRAELWAQSQTIDAVADRWEQTFCEAAGRTPTARRAAQAFELRPGVSVRIRAR
jgi:glycosyltransferase involved in cell wall biosynthesis